MLTTIYYSLAILAYSIFLTQFVISMLGGSDMDTDIDFDGDGFGELSWNDIFSFKGIIHFLMGFAGWLSLRSMNGISLTIFDYVVALVLGIVFVVVLIFVGRLLLKLKHEPTGQETQDFVGHNGVVTIVCDDEEFAYYVTIPDFGGYELKVYSYSNTKHSLGDEITILTMSDGKYYIQ